MYSSREDLRNRRVPIISLSDRQGAMPRLGPYFWGLAPGHLHLRVLPFFRFAFIAAHAVGQRAVIWYSSWMIFPNLHRAQGQSLGSGTHWVFAALFTLFFPSMEEAFPASVVFGFFCFMMIL